MGLNLQKNKKINVYLQDIFHLIYRAIYQHMADISLDIDPKRESVKNSHTISKSENQYIIYRLRFKTLIVIKYFNLLQGSYGTMLIINAKTHHVNFLVNLFRDSTKHFPCTYMDGAHVYAREGCLFVKTCINICYKCIGKHLLFTINKLSMCVCE